MAVTAAPKPGTETLGEELKHLSNAAKGWWSVGHGGSSPGLIAHYWLAAGGSPAHVNEAVAAALAESGGRAQAISGLNNNGTRDVGYWQINSSHGPGMASTDPLTNARAAVHLSKNGTDWSPWCTSYDDGICHGSTANPHYRGAGRGNRQNGSPVLGQAALGFLYAKDAIAGAYYGAQSAAGTVAPLNSVFDPVTSNGAMAADSGANLGGKIPGVSDVAGAGSDLADLFGGGTVGRVLAYAGYGLLAIFGASLMIGGLAVLVLALVDRHPNLAAITPVGKVAGAGSELRAGVSARAARNQGKGADRARQTKAGRIAHGEKTSTPKGRRTPTHGTQPRARRSYPADRPPGGPRRYVGGPAASRSETGF